MIYYKHYVLEFVFIIKNMNSLLIESEISNDLRELLQYPII